MTTTSLELEELNAKSAGIGTWVLKMHGIRRIEYEYSRQGTAQKGRKLECLLIAQSGTYCHGVIHTQWQSARSNGGGDPAAELNTMMKKSQDGSIFTLTKVALADAKAPFLGAPLEICIDLRKIKCTPILATLVQMPPAPVPHGGTRQHLGPRRPPTPRPHGAHHRHECPVPRDHYVWTEGHHRYRRCRWLHDA